MNAAAATLAPVVRPDRLFIGGEWISPATTDSFDVIDCNTEELYFRVAQASEADVDRAIAAARAAFDEGPWPQLSHAERAAYLRNLAEQLRQRSDALADLWPRESGALFTMAQASGGRAASVFDFYADLATSYEWEETATPTIGGSFALVVREPVGVVAAIIPWNAPLTLAVIKLAPALIAGCTVILKPAPEAPGSAYIIAEAAEAVGLPAGVLNVVTADREASERLVLDSRVDKVAFTGSTAAGRRIGSIMGGRIGRFTLELGGKSAAVLLDDADLQGAARTLADAECQLTGQVCASLTRIVVSAERHDDFVDALSAEFSRKRVGNAFDPQSQMGPLAMARQRDRVEGYIAQGVASGATLVTGGRRPASLDRGYFIEPTVFARVDNASTIAQEEIFGPVLCVIPSKSEQDAIRIANDTIYGLNASVFTEDADRARRIAARLQSGTVGQNGFRVDPTIGFGGLKQSGIGREGGRDGLAAYLETKTVVLDEVTAPYRA